MVVAERAVTTQFVPCGTTEVVHFTNAKFIHLEHSATPPHLGMGLPTKHGKPRLSYWPDGGLSRLKESRPYRGREEVKLTAFIVEQVSQNCNHIMLLQKHITSPAGDSYVAKPTFEASNLLLLECLLSYI